MHCDWCILPLLLPTPTICSSPDRKRRSRNRSRKKWNRSDSSDSDSVALMTPLATPIFDFRQVISALVTPLSTLTPTPTPTPSLVRNQPLVLSLCGRQRSGRKRGIGVMPESCRFARNQGRVPFMYSRGLIRYPVTWFHGQIVPSQIVLQNSLNFSRVLKLRAKQGHYSCVFLVL